MTYQVVEHTDCMTRTVVHETAAYREAKAHMRRLERANPDRAGTWHIRQADGVIARRIAARRAIWG